MDAADRDAIALFQALHAGDWKAARARFTPRFRAALREADMADLWRQVTGSLKDLEQAEIIDRAEYGELGLRVVSLRFTGGTAVAGSRLKPRRVRSRVSRSSLPALRRSSGRRVADAHASANFRLLPGQQRPRNPAAPSAT
jgi:hypothetical protein